MTAFFVCVFLFIVIGAGTALFYQRRAPRSIGALRAFSAFNHPAERTAIVRLEGEHGAVDLVLDDAGANLLSRRLLFLAGSLVPREAGATVAP